MATYLQGVTDYIPQFQPFQPDLNFYNNLLQTKQTQYDSNWKSINKIYGQYFYSDLSRKDNLDIKEELMKNIDFNLKRTSGLDLSLDQNVEQAIQVFKPFYEDKHLMKDMAYTKNYQNQRNNGLSLKNSKDPNERSQYWDPGIKDLDYRREEFREVSREESLNFASTTYTPYVNALDKYSKVAKDWGISSEITSPDASGNYMIRQKNGDLILPTLQTLFTAYGANDPQLQDVYFTQSYVNRKDYAYQHAGDFGGDKNAAERDYLNQATTTISNYASEKNKQYQKQSEGIAKEQNRTEKVISKNEDNLFTQGYLERLNEAAGYTTQAANAAEKLDKEVNEGSETAVTTGGTFNMDDDIETLRRKVDAGIASMLMDADISEAAYTYSRKDMVYEMKESQRGLEGLRQENRIKAINAKQLADQQNIILKNNLDQGILLTNANGEVYKKDLNVEIKEPVSADPFNPLEPDPEAQDIEDLNTSFTDEITKLYADTWINQAHKLVEEKYKDGMLSDLEYKTMFMPFAYSGTDRLFDFKQKKQANQNETVAGKVLSRFKGQGTSPTAFEENYTTPTDFMQGYAQDPTGFLLGKSQSSDPATGNPLAIIKMKIDALAEKSRGDMSSGDNYIMNTAQSGMKMDEYIMHAGAVNAVNASNTTAIQSALIADPKLYNIANGNASLMKSLATGFYDGNDIMPKEQFKTYVKQKLNLEDKDYYLYGQKIASNQDFLNNKITRGDLTNSILSKESNLTKFQKNELINKILYEQKKQHDLSEKSPTAGQRGWADHLNPIKEILSGYLGTLNNSDKYAGQIYDGLMNTYHKTAIDPNKVKIMTPLLKEITTSGGRAGVFAKGQSGVEVHLGAPQTFKSFVEFIKGDLSRIAFGDVNTTAISIKGTSKWAFDQSKEKTESDDGAQRDLLKRIINDLYTEISNKPGAKPFNFMQSQMAADNRHLGAMIIYPNKEQLDKYKAGTDEAGLSSDDINNALRYGISVIAPRENFTNSLFTQNFWTPMQTAVEASPDQKLVLSNPYGAGKVEIGKVKQGTGDYDIKFTTYLLKPDGNIDSLTTRQPNIMYGNNLDINTRELMSKLNLVSEINQEMFQNLLPQYKKVASASPIFKSIPVSMFPLIQISNWKFQNEQYQKNR